MTDLRKLHEAATPGPWEVVDHDIFADLWLIVGKVMRRADATLIGETRNAAPLILDVLDAARALPCPFTQGDHYVTSIDGPCCELGITLLSTRRPPRSEQAVSAAERHSHQTVESRDACERCGPIAAMARAAAVSEGLSFTVDLSVSAAQLSTWEPSRIDAFFAGIAKAINAKAGAK